MAPRFLSQTGLYSDAAKLKIDARNRTFSPQYPLWSDGATKRRWVRLPAGSQINVADLANWELPVGTKFWKEFSFNGRKVETRFLWQTRKNHWVFASYAWNDAQTDAELASESGVADIAEIADGKRHSIPSRQECRSCHDSSRTEILGFNALQLSDDRDPNALHAEPLTSEMVTLKTLVDENLMTPRRPELVTSRRASPPTRRSRGPRSATCRPTAAAATTATSSIASLGLDLTILTGQTAGQLGPLNAPRRCATTVGKRGHWVVPEAQEESRIINPGHPESSALHPPHEVAPPDLADAADRHRGRGSPGGRSADVVGAGQRRGVEAIAARCAASSHSAQDANHGTGGASLPCSCNGTF